MVTHIMHIYILSFLFYVNKNTLSIPTCKVFKLESWLQNMVLPIRKPSIDVNLSTFIDMPITLSIHGYSFEYPVFLLINGIRSYN
jgi:hypothetical protein